MSKRIIPIVLVVIGVLLIGSALMVFVKRSQKEKEIASPSADQTAEVSLPGKKEKLKTYNDEAGFSFNYPESLIVKEVENQDENTYSWLELTITDRPGEKMSIKVEDTNLLTSDDWLKKNRQEGWSINEVILSGMNGKLIHSTTKITYIAIEKEILFLIESPSDSESFWEKQNKIVSESFKVSWPTPKQTSVPAGDTGIEEIIE